jgi:hypothetical protein
MVSHNAKLWERRTAGRFPDAGIVDQQDKHFGCRYLLRRWFLLAPPAGLVISLFCSGSMRVSPCTPTRTLGCQRTLYLKASPAARYISNAKMTTHICLRRVSHYGNNLLGRRPRTVGTVHIIVGIGSADGDRRRLVVGTSGVGVRAGTVGVAGHRRYRSTPTAGRWPSAAPSSARHRAVTSAAVNVATCADG